MTVWLSTLSKMSFKEETVKYFSRTSRSSGQSHQSRRVYACRQRGRENVAIRASARTTRRGVRLQGQSRTAATAVTSALDNKATCVITSTFATSSERSTATSTSTPDIAVSVEVRETVLCISDATKFAFPTFRIFVGNPSNLHQTWRHCQQNKVCHAGYGFILYRSSSSSSSRPHDLYRRLSLQLS